MSPGSASYQVSLRAPDHSSIQGSVGGSVPGYTISRTSQELPTVAKVTVTASEVGTADEKLLSIATFSRLCLHAKNALQWGKCLILGRYLNFYFILTKVIEQHVYLLRNKRGHTLYISIRDQGKLPVTQRNVNHQLSRVWANSWEHDDSCLK